jgi:hypothetical protein
VTKHDETIGDDNLPVVDKPMTYVVSGEADYFRRPPRSGA